MPTYQERLVWGQGDGGGLIVLDTPRGQLGELCCWEHWMPLARLRRTRYRGQPKVQLGHILTATGLNFLRLGEVVRRHAATRAAPPLPACWLSR